MMKKVLKKIANALLPKRSLYEAINKEAGFVMKLDESSAEGGIFQVESTQQIRQELPQADVETSPEGEPQKIGSFSILEKIGSGAEGAVYKVFDESLNRELALKVMTAENPARRGTKNSQELNATLDRYYREIILQAGLRGRGVKEVHSAGWIENPQDPLGMSLYFTMPLSEESLQGREKIIPAMSPREMLTEMGNFETIIEALEILHEAGLLFHDMKPANVLRHESGVYQLADFGLALEMSPEPTTEPMYRGTILFLSPEKFRTRLAPTIIGPKSDYYSLTLTMYYLLTGGKVLSRNREDVGHLVHEMTLFSSRQASAVQRLNEIEDELVQAGVTPHLIEFILTGLFPDPAQRHENYREEFHEALAADREFLRKNRREGQRLAKLRKQYAEQLDQEEQPFEEERKETSNSKSSVDVVWTADESSAEELPDADLTKEVERIKQDLSEVEQGLKLIPGLLKNVEIQRKKSDEARISDIEKIGEEAEGKYEEVMAVFDLQEKAIRENEAELKAKKIRLQDHLKKIKRQKQRGSRAA